MSAEEKILEDQPTPEQAAEAKRAYMREYMRKRRQSKEHGDQYRATARESMREYMREYRQKPEVKAAAAERIKEQRAAEKVKLEELRLKNPKKYRALMEARRKAKRKYMKQYNARPEVKARRRELFEQKPEEVKQRIKKLSNHRAKLSRVAKANGVDTKKVRAILEKFVPPVDTAA